LDAQMTNQMSAAWPDGAPLRINVLGPVECWAGNDRVSLGGVIQERVLAALALEAGHVMSVPQLVNAVWEEEPPATATHQVRKAVARLRQLVPGGGKILVTESSGYRMTLEPSQLDLAEFSALLAAARSAVASDRTEKAIGHFEHALALWRGTVLAGDGGEPMRAAGAVLLERRVAAFEQLTDLHLARGRSGELVAELRALVAAHPLRERLRGQLMLALFRSGRQAEALAEFGRVRALLAEELGIDPGSELTALHERMLRNDPDLAVPEPSAVRQTAHRPAPPMPVTARSLPNDLADFIGRKRELEILRSYTDAEHRQGPRVVAIDGMGGVGKTSLAVRAAYSASDRYPDGQLYLDLNGFTPAELPMTAPAAAEALLRMLGVAEDHLPDEPTARINLWRTTVADRSVLLLLDNVRDVAQARPLLPPNSRSLVLITSRTRLIDLDGAQWLSLGTMTGEESTAMAAAVLSTQRTAAEPEAVADLLELCGYLPLAIRIALSRLANRPRWSIGYLVDRMSDESRRLDELRSDERGVELTLKISYEGLESRHREAFRLLGSHPGHDIDATSAAALLGTAPDEAENTLEVLLDAHMLQQQEFGYYRFHDLVRSFVHQLPQVSDLSTEPDAPEALERLLNYFVRVSDHVCDLLFADRLRLSPKLPAGLPVPARLHHPGPAREWLARERATIEAAVVLAYQKKFDWHVAYLAHNVVFQLDAVGLYTQFAEVAELSVRSSRRLANPELLRLSLSNLAVATWKLGRFEAGIAAASEALKIAEELGDRRGFAKDTGILGLLTATIGRFAEALPLLRESVRIKREVGAGRAEAESLANLSSLYEQWGRYPEAAEAARRAVALDSRLGIHEHLIIARTDLARAYLGMRAIAEADEQLGQARILIDEFGATAGDVALVFALSALIGDRLGRHEEARGFADRALEYRRDRWPPNRQVEIDNVVGQLRRAQGNPARAVDHHERARSVAATVGYRVEEARALLRLGDAMTDLGRVTEGEEHRQRANDIFTELEVPVSARR
jgi:DNA-binding SARP family transcriptional activator/tetratricopeptide (TPR) repeat protein